MKHVAEVWDASDNGSSTLQCEFINAAHISSPQQILHKIAGSVDNKPLDIKKVELSLLQTKKNRKHPPVILILDEIDLLLVGKNNRIQTAKGEEPFLKTLFRWASDPQSKFILIGISNSVGNRNAKRLDKLGKVSFHASHIIIFLINHLTHNILCFISSELFSLTRK